MSMAGPLRADSAGLGDREFAEYRDFLYRTAGISLSPTKKIMISGRLMKRLRHHGFGSHREYLKLLADPAMTAERQIAIDLLTTNETSFFREPQHFELLGLQAEAIYRRQGRLRIWSAACSSGEEPYTIAMVLADKLGFERSWEVTASDISTRVLERARSATYAMERADRIPRDYLQRYCLKGVGSQAGTFRLDDPLRARVRFMSVNLNAALPGSLGSFGAIFLRNVMIYFDTPTKARVVTRLVEHLEPGGYLFIGHSESITGMHPELDVVRPAVYQRR